MLAGLSGLYIFKMPPCLWAKAASLADSAISNAPTVANARNFCFISVYLPWLSPVWLVPSWLGSLTKPVGEPCYPRLISELSFKMRTVRSLPYIVPRTDGLFWGLPFGKRHHRKARHLGRLIASSG